MQHTTKAAKSPYTMTKIKKWWIFTPLHYLLS